MKMKDTTRWKYDLYLLDGVDDRLIEHLEKFKASRRINEELRRMLYLALHGQVNQVAHQRATPARPVELKREAPGQGDPPASDVKGKLKKMFGMPGV